jgi:hypothetical protein
MCLTLFVWCKSFLGRFFWVGGFSEKGSSCGERDDRMVSLVLWVLDSFGRLDGCTVDE